MSHGIYSRSFLFLFSTTLTLSSASANDSNDDFELLYNEDIDNNSIYGYSLASSVQDDYEYRNIFRDDTSAASEADATHGEANTYCSRFSSDTSLNSGFTNVFGSRSGQVGQHQFGGAAGAGRNLLGGGKGTNNNDGEDDDDDDSMLLWNNEDKYLPVVERRYEVTIPAGSKSGIILDTNINDNTSYPTIHQLKPNSVLLLQSEKVRVNVGDKLLSVDGHDCRYLTATQIGKLLSPENRKNHTLILSTTEPATAAANPKQ